MDSGAHSPAAAPRTVAALWWAAGIAALALAARLWVASSTHATAEDFLISLRYADNIAAGRGFAYNPGQHVLGTTTPLYTLMLAGARALGTNAACVGKLLNILADSASCFVLARLLARPPISRPVAGLFAALAYAVGSTPINISVGGMETGLVTLTGLLAVWAYLDGAATELWLVGGVLFLLRVDGLVLFAILACALALQQRRIPLRAISAFVLVVAPWVAFAFAYFGSPVPTSLVAKLLVYGHGVATSRNLIVDAFVTQFASGWLQRAITLLFAVGAACIALHALRAAAWRLETGGRGVSDGLALSDEPDVDAALGSAARLQRLRGRTGPRSTARASLHVPAAGSAALAAPLVWLLVYYAAMFTSKVPPFAWYFLPPWPLFLGIAALGAAWIGSQAAARMPTSMAAAASRVWALALAGCVLAGIAHLRSVRRDVAATQRVEDTLRVPMGLWLRSAVAPDQRILLEPIGYVGYYSHRPILDMIGLVSPEVFPSYRTGRPLADIVERLRPEWLALRPGEIAALRRQGVDLPSRQYSYVRDFAVPGRKPDFLIFRRTDVS